jgi:hypothetical protein
MSLRGEKHHSNSNTCKWILKQLEAKDVHQSGARISLLDVGALHFNYTQPWIDAKAIDLHSTDPLVTQQDFFELLNESEV